MKAVGVIPARWASTRLPGKILSDIGGKPMLQHVWERAKRALELAEVIVACDEQAVLTVARSFGATAVMTRADHPSGSDRVAEAVANYAADIVVNIQGDEPFIEPGLIDALVSALRKDPVPVMATVIKAVTGQADLVNPNIVKVVIDKDHNALYFSRAAIPYHRDGEVSDYSRYFRHLGIYAYRSEFLKALCRWPKSFLEQEECLEQLRVLEQGYKIKTVRTETDTIGVDTPEDLMKAREYYEKTRR
ncbi:MAG: 3-deoxy-manno-octulosonate cytidylyltransferase [Candidatus Omnitrophica bacterium]|nr:3-deoxy-manno-octulosonate cytidylyltransferase [Candidatus Omnitrophota bacterium]